MALTKQDLDAIDRLMEVRFRAMDKRMDERMDSKLQYLIDAVADMIGGLTTHIDERFDEITPRVDNHERRIAKLESWRAS